MSYIYLASPHSHPNPTVVAERYERVKNLACRLLTAGHLVLSPITYNHVMAAENGLSGNWEFWKKIDTCFLEQAEQMWIYTMDGWKESVGIREEILIAKGFGKQIWLIDDELELERYSG